MGRIKLSIAMLLPALTVAISALAACGGPSDTPRPAATDRVLAPTFTTAPTATRPRPEIRLAPRQLNLELEGEGPRTLGPITINTGVMIAFVRYEGKDPFSMTFLGGDKGLVKSIESSLGPYRGERIHSVFEGNG